ncbi:hypothetical protein BU169_00525 [Corynebacterium diphtheriae]|nr:hypothetical protein BU161_03535 [Corynebacterium diphtheriae]OWM55890.1 hypothetical protein BU169_00525 [Corynebacterium diphtheriae]
MAVRLCAAELTKLDYFGALILKKFADLLKVQRWRMQHWGVAMGSTTRKMNTTTSHQIHDLVTNT